MNAFFLFVAQRRRENNGRVLQIRIKGMLRKSLLIDKLDKVLK